MVTPKKDPSEINKRGPATKEELEFIRDNSGHMTITEMAKKLNRSYGLVRDNIKKSTILVDTMEADEFVDKLHLSFFWPEVQKSLSREEIPFFEQQWAAYCKQFSTSNVLATDENMIKDLVMLEILTNRALIRKGQAEEEIKSLDKKISLEIRKKERDRDSLEIMKATRNALVQNITALGREHIQYQEKKDDKLKDLKGTREQRFKQLEESRRNIFELLKELDERDKRESEGRFAEKMRVATEKVADDWSQTMQYDDGQYDKPYLCPEREEEQAREMEDEDE